MSTPTGPSHSSTWETLDPWEKAAQWHRVAPEISEKILELAAERAREQMIQDRKRLSFEMKLAESRDKHLQSMDIRLWWTTLIGFVGGLLCVAGLTAVAWHYADSGNLVPGLAIFGLGSSLTAGTYGVGRAISRKIGQQASQPEDSTRNQPSEPGEGVSAVH